VGERPEEIRRDIEETRERMGEKVEAIAAKADLLSRYRNKATTAKNRLADQVQSWRAGPLTQARAQIIRARSLIEKKRRGGRHSVAVAGIVHGDEGRILLMRRRDHRNWEPPGGVLELHEEILEGVAREVAEETGIEVRPVQLTGIYKNMDQGVVSLVFRCAPTGGDGQVTDEAIDCRWASFDDAIELVPEPYAAWLRDAFSDDAAPAVRVEKGTPKGASSSPTEEPVEPAD
jgi:8-oxo-dGTP pyrophosphatase MutT (NUDIX family)